MSQLYEKLQKIADSDQIPMHMPGHKRKTDFHMVNPYQIDVTEIDGTDDLHHPEGVLKQEMQRAARLYGSRESFFLINGSTAGILTSVFACARRDDTILMARNCHKSVYHAAFLGGMKQAYILPAFSEKTGIMEAVTKEDVEEALDQMSTKPACVVITSPTYEGIISPVREIAWMLHQQGIPLIVDEAHGAHLHFQKDCGESALDAGADLVIHSLHKTLPSLTGTGLLHWNSDLVPVEEVRRYEGIFQTSSPSYILMTSISQCLDFLENAKQSFSQYSVRLARFYDKMKRLRYLNILCYDNSDRGKIVITTEHTCLKGNQLMELLRTHAGIELEMCQERYGIAMATVCDEEKDLDALADALLAIDQQLVEDSSLLPIEFSLPEQRCSAYEASYAPYKTIKLSESVGEIAGEYVYLYPPGIPYLVPGEVIDETMVCLLLRYIEEGFSLYGMEDQTGKKIRVVDTEIVVE